MFLRVLPSYNTTLLANKYLIWELLDVLLKEMQ